MQYCIRVRASLKSEKTDWEGEALGLGLNTTRAGTRGAQSSVRPIPRFTHAFELTKSMLQALKEFIAKLMPNGFLVEHSTLRTSRQYRKSVEEFAMALFTNMHVNSLNRGRKYTSFIVKSNF